MWPVKMYGVVFFQTNPKGSSNRHFWWLRVNWSSDRWETTYIVCINSLALGYDWIFLNCMYRFREHSFRLRVALKKSPAYIIHNLIFIILKTGSSKFCWLMLFSKFFYLILFKMSSNRTIRGTFRGTISKSSLIFVT